MDNMIDSPMEWSCTGPGELGQGLSHAEQNVEPCDWHEPVALLRYVDLKLNC